MELRFNYWIYHTGNMKSTPDEIAYELTCLIATTFTYYAMGRHLSQAISILSYSPD